MSDDEREIRQWVATWMEATQRGDVDTILGLMSEDVVFLMPGQRSMVGRSAFAEASRRMPGVDAPRFEGTSEIQEIQVLGDWAYLRTRLTVVATPPGGRPMTRAGFTLSILRKENGRWVLARDANMLSPVPDPT